MNNDSIFMEQVIDQPDISGGKVSYTDILNTVPKNKVKEPLVGWEKDGKTEWRWRFLSLPDDTRVVEISYKSPDTDRVYFNKHGQWVNRDIPKVYDQYVNEVYYCYAHKDD